MTSEIIAKEENDLIIWKEFLASPVYDSSKHVALKHRHTFSNMQSSFLLSFVVLKEMTFCLLVFVVVKVHHLW